MLLSLPPPTPPSAEMLPGILKKRRSSSNNFVTRTSCRLFLRPQQQQHRPDQDLIDAALLRAKAAVQYDADGQIQLAIEAYAETIGLLCQVQQDPTPSVQRIHDAYADRIVELSTRESIQSQRNGKTHGNSNSNNNSSSSNVVVAGVDKETDFYHLHHWTLLKKIKQSMIFGGPITGRLYVPKELWHQPLVNLPDLDRKLALAEHLLRCLKATRHHHSHQHAVAVAEPRLILQELDRLYQALHEDRVQITKKSTTTTRWLKWSKKPVDRMRHMSTTMTLDDRYPMYIRTLIKVFSTAQFLDMWYHEYSDLAANTSATSLDDHHHQVLDKISTCAETLGRILSTTVMADFHLLWDAWVAKGNNYWMD